MRRTAVSPRSASSSSWPSGPATSSWSRARSGSCRRSASRSCGTWWPPARSLILLRLREGSIRLPRGDIVKVALLGVVGFGCYQILWTVALDSIPAGDSALLIATTPVMTALLAVALRVDAPNPAKLIGALISFVGVAMVIAAGQGLDLRVSIGGDLLTLGAAFAGRSTRRSGRACSDATRPSSRPRGRSSPGCCSSPRSGIAQLATADLSGFGPPVVLAILYSGTLAAGFANVVVFHGVKLLGPTRVTFAPVARAGARGGPRGGLPRRIRSRPIQIVGGVVILAGVALLRRGSWPTRPTRPTARTVRRLAG